MPYMNVDDQMHGHRKFVKLGKERMPATGLWITAGSWCAAALTDGFIPEYIVRQWDPRLRLARLLVSVELWHEDKRDDESGFRFHQWTVDEGGHNLVSTRILEKRNDNRVRQQRHRDRMRETRLGGDEPPPAGRRKRAGQDADPVPDTASRNGVRNALRNEGSHASPARDVTGVLTDLPSHPIQVTTNERTSSSRAAAVHDTSTMIESAAVEQATTTTQDLVAEWIDHCRSRPPGRVIGQVGKELRAMIDEGIPYATVRTGLQQWQLKGLHPSALASVVNEVANGSPGSVSTGRRRGGRQNADDKIRTLLGDVPTFPGGPPQLRAIQGDR